MTETHGRKISSSIIAQLNSGVENEVIRAIDHLRYAGFPEYLPYIFKLLGHTESDLVIRNILKFLGELKDQRSVSYLMDAIAEEEFVLYRSQLITCCWQNGLDYSEYLPLWVDLVITCDFETAFEAFTVIENLEFWPDQEVRHSAILKINQAIIVSDNLKSNLLKALRKILS